MKIEIQNLGPIHHFEFDLEKDLHLLYGKNNVGKSYAVNVVYCVLKSFQTTFSFSLKYFVADDIDGLSRLDRVKKTFEETFIEKIDEYLRNTYSSLEGQNGKEGEITIETKKGKISIRVNKGSNLELGDINFYAAKKIIEKKDDEFNVVHQIYDDFLIFSELTALSHLYILPASKSGLYAALSGMGEMMAELSKLRNKITSKIGIPSLQETVSDYYLNLMSANEKNVNANLLEFAEQIESNFLEGGISFNDMTKKIYYQPINSEKYIHITETASIVSELAPLVLFLKNVIQQKETKGKTILIIEEPEAHLHPEVQVQLMEIFAQLTKHNVKVILTSHSDFMLNKVTNMILAKEIESKKVGVYHLEMTEEGSIVKSDMEATDEGIEDHNFMDISTKLYEERMNILENQNQPTHAAGEN